MLTRSEVLLMVNEIKLDALASVASLTKGTRKDTVVNAPTVAEDAITITNSLGSLVTKMMADNSVPDNQQRIIELKQKIDNNQYHVDIDKLAGKLTHTLLNVK
jgi:anti-sigma28 factor (negative regulator of flagellin synthesis)